VPTLSKYSEKPLVMLTPTTQWIICEACGYVIATVVGRDVDVMSQMIRGTCRLHRRDRGCAKHSAFRVVNGVWREDYGARAKVIWNY